MKNCTVSIRDAEEENFFVYGGSWQKSDGAHKLCYLETTSSNFASATTELYLGKASARLSRRGETETKMDFSVEKRTNFEIIIPEGTLSGELETKEYELFECEDCVRARIRYDLIFDKGVRICRELTIEAKLT